MPQDITQLVWAAVVENQRFDIVVVGAGPAGTSAAYAALGGGGGGAGSREGRGAPSVAVIEKERVVAETVRTSGVTWVDDAREFGIPADCYNPVDRFEFCSPGNRVSAGGGGGKGDARAAAVLDVRRTYRWLACQARARGARFFVGTTARSAVLGGPGGRRRVTGVRAVSHDGVETEFSARVVVDASGFQSAVARSAGVAGPWKRFGAGAEMEARVEHVQRNTWWLMVGQMYSPAGYAWIFPLDGHTVRIGVGVGKPDSPVDPAARLAELVDNRVGPIRGLGRIHPLEYHHGLIPNDGLREKTVYDGLMLVGDSAGQANPLVLEGIRYAIRFGRVAGEVAAGAVAAGDTTAAGLAEYERRWKREIGSRIRAARRVQDRWVGLSDAQWDQELDIIAELGVEEFVDFIRADFGPAGVLRLAVGHPRMAVRRLFGMVRNAVGSAVQAGGRRAP